MSGPINYNTLRRHSSNCCNLFSVCGGPPLRRWRSLRFLRICRLGSSILLLKSPVPQHLPRYRDLVLCSHRRWLGHFIHLHLLRPASAASATTLLRGGRR